MDTKQKIPLRAFYRKIENLIINQEIDAAISHAEFLIEKHPKNIAVYKLLGKAFLEKQEFDYANTVFEKILQVEPDDFVSHIGISMVAESFGNLKKSLISMRRAYELEPTNETLQNEVKRLIEAKDGIAPDQIRLTRGALIKMYSRSQLADQAIAEARLGVQENPERVDFKIHLANMFFSSGRKIKAIETCIDIISTLPYCKSALVILYQSFAPLDNTNDSTIYKTRLAEIDPYFAFIKPDTKSVDDIPDIAIMVEEKDKPSTPIDDLNQFIKESWEHTALYGYDEMSLRKSQPEDWTSIIEDAVTNNGIGAPITDTSYEEVILPNDDPDTILESQDQRSPSTITKKDRLRRKLFARQKELRDEESIPTWVLDSSLHHEDDEEKKDELAKSSFLEKSTLNEFEGKPVPEISLTKSINSEDITNHKPMVRPSSDSLDLGQDISTSEINDYGSLDDTQRLEVIPDDPKELFTQAFNNIKRGKIRSAHHRIEKLIQENYKLEDLAIQLEEVCHENPEKVDLWLLLVEIYKKLGFKEKTLDALEKAQNNLSL